MLTSDMIMLFCIKVIEGEEIPNGMHFGAIWNSINADKHKHINLERLVELLRAQAMLLRLGEVRKLNAIKKLDS